MAYSKLDVIQILEAANEEWTIKEFADLFGCSDKTVNRWLDSLFEMGMINKNEHCGKVGKYHTWSAKK